MYLISVLALQIHILTSVVNNYNIKYTFKKIIGTNEALFKLKVNSI